MLIILRGQRSVLYSSESSPADCSSLGYSVTNDIFRWHSLSCKHLWGWCSQENELRKAKNRKRAVTRHEDLPFLLWEGGISSLCRDITLWFANGLGLCKGGSWNLYLSTDCWVSPVNESTQGHGGGKVPMGSCPTEQFTETPATSLPFLKPPGLRRRTGSCCWPLFPLRSHKVTVAQVCGNIHTRGKNMAGRDSDTMGAHSLVWLLCGKLHGSGSVMSSLRSSILVKVVSLKVPFEERLSRWSFLGLGWVQKSLAG